MKRYNYILISCLLLLAGNITGQDDIDRELKRATTVQKDSIKLLLKQGDSLQKAKNIEEAETSYLNAFRLARKTGDKKRIIQTGFRLERFLSAIAEKHENARHIIDFVYDFCEKVDDQDCLAISTIRYGELNQRQSNFIKALRYFNEAMQRAENTKSNDNIWEACTARGLLFMDIGDLDQSKIDFKQALRHIKDDSDYRKGITYINISASFSDHQPDSTIYYSKLALQGCKNNKTSRTCNLAYNNMAWSYVQKGMAQEALALINNNIDFDNIQYNDRDSLYPALMHTLAFIYFKLGDYEKAITHFKIAERFFIKKNDVANIIITKEDLSKSYEQTGNLAASLKLMREIKPLISTLDNIKISKEIAKIESKKLLAIKEEQILDLEEENFKIGQAMSKSRWFSYLLGAFLLAALFFLLYRGHANRVRFHQLNEELSLNRLKSLRSTMNPHFLFNSFSTLQNFILKKDNLKANEYMTELSGLIRNILSSSDSIYINFKEELQILQSYINIEQERFSESFEVIYDIDDTLVETNPVIPSMVIQPYIENAIIHGFSHSKKKGKLMVSFAKGTDTVFCKVRDNGIGRLEAERLQKEGNDTIHLSIATRNTDERLRILSRIGNDNANVRINDLIDDTGASLGTEVIITLPIINEHK